MNGTSATATPSDLYVRERTRARARGFDWRRPLRWLLLYIPFSGILPLATYPHNAPATLLKDFAFTVPAYVGAAAAVMTRRERLNLPGAPVLLFSAFTVLVIVGMLNPNVPNPLVATIGARVWLFTPPLMVLGYHLFRSKIELQRTLKWMLIGAMVPCTVGIAEAMLVAAGQSGRVYAFYGPAAAAATQGFAQFDFGGGAFARLPSLFTAISQYWLFTTATIAVAYAAWRGNRDDPTMRWLGPVGLGVALVASMTAGARAGFIFSPLLLLMIVALDGVHLGRLLGYAAASVSGIFMSLKLLGIQGSALASSSSEHTSFILSFFGDGFDYALPHALTGLGTGVDTGAIHNAFSSLDYGVIYNTVGGVWWESWYLKAILELGFAGLALLLALILTLTLRGIANHRRLADPQLRSMSAAFLALFVWNAIYAVKTAYIDFDPMVVYVWTFLGVQWGLVRFASNPAR